MARAAVLLAEGFEEIEAVTIIDVLRRAEIDTVVLGVSGRTVTGSHGISIAADALLGERASADWDIVVLPGGMPGAANLRDNAEVQALLRSQNAKRGRLAAICAAPIALEKAGVLEGRRATSYPSFRGQLASARYVEEAVVTDDRVITSRGPGTALRFALEIVAALRGAKVADKLAEGMLAARA